MIGIAAALGSPMLLAQSRPEPEESPLRLVVERQIPVVVPQERRLDAPTRFDIDEPSGVLALVEPSRDLMVRSLDDGTLPPGVPTKRADRHRSLVP